MELTPRKERILSSVVAGYVKSGEPVGSKAVAEEVGVSSATVRNEMADLIELGLLEQPHTSAGRVPSQKGYREYVDRLMEVPPVKGGGAPGVRFHAALRLLRAGTAAGPGGAAAGRRHTVRRGGHHPRRGDDGPQVRAVQFVQTSRRTAMLILMSSAGTMKTRVFHCDFDLTNDILRVFFRVFNGKLAGKNVRTSPPLFAGGGRLPGGDVRADGAPLRALLEVARDTMGTEVLLAGQMNLLFYPELEHGAPGV